MAEVKRYLIVVQLRGDSRPERLTTDVPQIIEYLNGFAIGQKEVAFRSNDGLLFGFFLNTDRAAYLLPEFEKCVGTSDGDSLLSFEAGDVAGFLGSFSRAGTWLQRH